MTTLLTIHDAVTELTYHLQQLNGGVEDAGIVRRLGGVEKVLRELSPVYRAEEDVSEKSVFWTAVLGREMAMAERVKMLMENKIGSARMRRFLGEEFAHKRMVLTPRSVISKSTVKFQMQEQS